MENSASNSPVIQAQAARLLSVITQAMLIRQCCDVIHQRLSWQHNSQMQGTNVCDGIQDSFQSNFNSHTAYHSYAKRIAQDSDATEDTNSYQGLTRAQHQHFGNVMVKWELTHTAANNSKNTSNLNHEIEVLQRLNHYGQYQSNGITIAPSVLAYHDEDIQIFGRSQRLILLIMPYYETGSLANQLKQQKYPSLTDKQKYYFIHQSANLLASVHQAGWLHNDIKPSNILLNNATANSNSHISSDLLLTDFALAEQVDTSKQANPTGTPAYLAPERWQGKDATVQSDIYAFGIMIFEILMGKRPFNIRSGSNEPFREWAIQHCQQPIPKLLPEYSHYQFIIDKALAKRIERRYQDMDKMLIDLTLLDNG